uniref:PRC-barrel domain-containing protein n=1 Tax=Noccaea caerulescens TaxID=107243 RepID=A0A1J3KAN3_NOCCA
MCSCSSSLFLSQISENCRWRLKHSIINTSHVSVHEMKILSSSKARARCYFGGIDSHNSALFGKFSFKEKSRDKFVSCLSSSSVPNNEEAVVDSSPSVLVENDSAEFPRDGDLIRLESGNDLRNTGSKGFKQTTRRSSLVAKQVISIQSALSLGFISQLWVDTTSWLVLVVDVKPSLLSGECERFLLKDIVRVGDVVLVEDEAVLDTEFKMVGLETLVGYRVVTPGGRNIGKVRGYSFNINSGIVESLELDSFGVTIIPSSLVSTYRLQVEDIMEVLEDIVVVHEDAASRKQRLTKGLWDAQFGSEYSDVEELENSSDRRRQRRSSRKKRDLDDDDEWDIFR